MKDVIGLVVFVVAMMFVLAWLALNDGHVVLPSEDTMKEWLRTLAPVGTFIVAVLAYRHWRRPDDAKRRADTAQLIIRQSQNAETAVLSARYGTLSFHRDNGTFSIEDKMESAAEAAGKPMTKEVARAKKELHDFRTYRTEAAALYSRSGIDESIDKAEGLAKGVISAHNTVHFLDERHRAMLGPQKFEDLLNETLARLGIGHADKASTDGGTEQFEKDLQAAFDEVRAKLVKFLVAQ